ncbi:hypothetical protein ACS0TY_033260 [Phlomoides rotata]
MVNILISAPNRRTLVRAVLAKVWIKELDYGTCLGLTIRMNALMHRTIVVVIFGIIIMVLKNRQSRRTSPRRRYSVLDRIPAQIGYMHDLVEVNDEDCRNNLRMDRSTFHKLCYLLQSLGGLTSSRNITVAEKVAMCVKFQFKHSGQTVSKHFHAVLHCVLRLHHLFLVKPTPIQADSTDPRWKKFETNDDTYPEHIELVDSLDTSPEWTAWRDTMANNIMESQKNPVANDEDKENGKICLCLNQCSKKR